MEIRLKIYQLISGKCPFNDWVEGIVELHTRAKILTRLDRLKLGNFGDCKSLGEGVSELRIHYGPGLRIYFSRLGQEVILLLCGGDKGTQNKDIKKAKEYLKEYIRREKKNVSK